MLFGLIKTREEKREILAKDPVALRKAIVKLHKVIQMEIEECGIKLPGIVVNDKFKISEHDESLVKEITNRQCDLANINFSDYESYLDNTIKTLTLNFK